MDWTGQLRNLAPFPGPLSFSHERGVQPVRPERGGVLVTGGAGFLGRPVCERSAGYGPAAVVVPRKAEYDLTEQAAVRRVLDDAPAGRGASTSPRSSAGSGPTARTPAGSSTRTPSWACSSWRRPAAAGSGSSSPSAPSARTRSSRRCRSARTTSGTATRRRRTPPTASPRRRSWSRRQAYRQQYGFNAITLLPVNLYGPGDNFDPASSHVIPALIRKAVEARDAGRPTSKCGAPGRRRGSSCSSATRPTGWWRRPPTYDDPDPVNLGSGQEITIRRWPS